MSVLFVKVKSNKEASLYSDPVPSNKIGSQLKPLVNALRFLSGYPIYPITLDNGKSKGKRIARGHYEGNIFKSDDSETAIQYELISFNWTCPLAWYSYIVKVFNMFMMLSFVSNAGLNIAFPAKLINFGPSFFALAGPTAVILNTSLFLFSGVLKVVECIVLFLNAKPFVDWLNNWSIFEKHFLNCFGSEKHEIEFKFDITKFRRLALVYWFYIPSLFFLFFWMPFIAPSFVLHVEYLSMCLLVWGTFVLWELPILEETKLHIAFRTTILAFEQVRFGITKMKERGNIEPSDAIKLRSLIILLRKQMSIFLCCIKSQQLLHVADTIFACSMGLSYLLIAVSQGDLYKISAVPFVGTLVQCSICLTKLYLKVIHAESIPEQEMQLAAELLEIEGKCSSPTKVELKFLYNLLTQNTVTVNLGNYCCLDKKLLLQVGVQVVTYLIVVIQFQGNNSSDAKV